jgi:hypothetical protein
LTIKKGSNWHFILALKEALVELKMIFFLNM